MKHLYLLLLSLIAFTANAQIEIGTIEDYYYCDYDNNGTEIIDLGSYNSIVLGNNNPSLYTVAYFLTNLNAQQNTNRLPLSYVFSASATPQQIYVRVTENEDTSNFVITSFQLIQYTQPIANQAAPLTLCDNDSVNDGSALFDLTTSEAQITAGCNECTVSYYETSEYLTPIGQPQAYANASNPQIIYVKVTNGCYNADTTITLNVVPVPQPVNLPMISSQICATGRYDLTQNNALYNPLHQINFYATESDANAGLNPITTPTDYATAELSVWVRVANVSQDPDAPSCYIVLQQPLSRILNATIIIDGQNITIAAYGVAPFSFSVDNISQQDNYFPNLSLGNHTARIVDNCANSTVIQFTITNPNPPTGESTQTFTAGQTLADVEVTGENVQWYRTATGGIALPLSTLLEDGTMYYAAQSINNTESVRRLAVTAALILGSNNNPLKTLAYYPNPVTNMLTVKNQFAINGIKVFNTLGHQVIESTINATEISVDFSALNNGIYFVKVKAGDAEQTIRIVKK